MSLEIAWKQNILGTDFNLLKLLLVVLGLGLQAFICGFSRQNIFSVGQLLCSIQISIHISSSASCNINYISVSDPITIMSGKNSTLNNCMLLSQSTQQGWINCGGSTELLTNTLTVESFYRYRIVVSRSTSRLMTPHGVSKNKSCPIS